MSKVIIRNEKQLLQFLSVLAEQSVQQAYTGMGGEQQQQQVAKDIRMSKKTFIEEEDPPSAPAESPPEPALKKTEPADQTATDKASISPKFDSLIDAINDLRGSPSSRDTSVETQLRAYYDKLDAAEAASAILFIRTLSQVMKGEVEGASAPDPSYYQISTSMKSDAGSKEAPPEVAAPKEPVASIPQEKPDTEEEEAQSAEDTEPPIKVGSQQVTEAYRNKIKLLLSRG